ncbi:MAG: rRNA pseudouridine synthase [Verrucomicrobiales bacterium]|nr:rRNA pseudouridine synthase [Verrucomicrobiales bacterium]
MGEEFRRLRVDQLLSRFGYCSRREAPKWVREGRVTANGVALESTDRRVDPRAVQVDGAAIEGPCGLLVLFHKPAGVVCSRDEREGTSVYDLLPPRWSARNPPITTVGRLDRETTGLLLITDVGEWVHRWTSPRHHVVKTYEATLDGPVKEEWKAVFASGELRLDGEDKPCLPAQLTVVSEREGRLDVVEGRYHQVRRMFAAVGAGVTRLHRSRFGPYELGDLPEGQWRFLEPPCFG